VQNLKKKLAKTDDPNERARIEKQIKALEGCLANVMHCALDTLK
jgi:hypothetical protein